MKASQAVLKSLGLVGPPSYPPLSSDHPASIQFAAWLTAFNTGERNTLLEYHNGPAFPYSIASHDVSNIELEAGLALASGGFNVADIESASDSSTVVVVMKEKVRPQYARATMVVDTSNEEYFTTKFEIHPIIVPLKFIPKDDPRRPSFEKSMQPLTADTRQALINGIAEVVRDQYIIPDTVENIISALQNHIESGDYDDITESVIFSERLTQDIQSAAQDKHMGIAFLGPPNLDGESRQPPPKEIRDYLKSTGFGFCKTTLDQTTIPGRTIATIPIKRFVPSETGFPFRQEVRAAIAKILSGISEADALIVDLRENHGGDPRTMSFILAFLLDDGPVHLIDMVDKSGNTNTTFSTDPPSELPEGSTRFGGSKPVFVLTSERTISGGEEMVYNLQAFKRSRAVIGEGNAVTAGEANPITRPRGICEEIFGNGWLLLVPHLRPVHSVTGTSWEAKGVLSDIVAGEGEWEGVSDAEEIAKRLIKKIFDVTREERLEL